ncbi:hypothetical protein [Aquimarina sp. MMG016]|uniref:hypothetical protein n=1 Tax=Aquimarina sp. MMG016 TaxID=2822690 RepID=UPI001B3A1BA3|nr:hypothetical protein [Aquimarina sp. MMG016]MBQ4819060.1 hypothetical protein [Aquimarina sp. MMG016]
MFLSFFTSVFNSDTVNENIFISYTDPKSNRTIMIEEDDCSVWCHLLQKDKEGIDFDGFLCSVIDPKLLDVNIDDILELGNTPPLSKAFSNKHSYVKNLRKKDIKIYWEEDQITITIRKETYLVMNLKEKTSYSKAISKDGPYGKSLQD